MTDFYQILKREAEPNVEKTKPDLNLSDFDVDNKPVDNSIDAGSKKNKLINQGVIKKTASRKLTEKKFKKVKPDRRRKAETTLLSLPPANPIWLTMAEAAKLGGVQKRTIKRAVRSGSIKYRIIERRYQVDFASTLLYFFSKKKLWNKLKVSGLGQYVEKWRN